MIIFSQNRAFLLQRLFIFLLYIYSFSAFEIQAQETGALYGRPEPMVFDLVDPLGAKKNELEVNSLFDYSNRTGLLEWSPEVEYSFMKGHAIELELPFDETHLTQYKISLQGTLGRLVKGNMIHGWQVIGRKIIEEKNYGMEALYLNDYKFSENWSMMNMFGIRRTNFSRLGEFVSLSNNSIFYTFPNRIIVGIELNSEIMLHNFRYRFTPQIQYPFNKHISFQIGGGPSQLNDVSHTEWLITSRLIYDF